MEKSFLRSCSNRILHLMARFLPGSLSLRPFLHRLRGVTVRDGVFIGDEVYLDNENPECIEIHENVIISMRTLLIAHTRGPGRIVLERNAFVGPNVVICCSAGRIVRIGEGAVISAGSVITRSVPAQVMVMPPPSITVARVTVPFTRQTTMAAFLAGLELMGPSATEDK